MKRREFITLLGSAAAWPLAARAQQPAIPLVGYLSTGTLASDNVPLPAFRQGLAEIGYIEGRNIAIEYRWAEFQYERLPALATDLVRRRVAVIATIGGTPPAIAAKEATSTIPIVFYLGVDPVQFGLVASLNRPGGNVTGIAGLQTELAAKRVELLHELVPRAAGIVLLVNPTNPYTVSEAQAVHDAARTLGLQVREMRASTAAEVDASFKTLDGHDADALLINGDLFLLSRRDQLVATAARLSMPAVYGWREYCSAGGMICYTPSLADGFRLVGNYTGRIVKGASPAELPVQQVVKVELIINSKATKALGLEVPPTLLARADEVIE